MLHLGEFQALWQQEAPLNEVDMEGALKLEGLAEVMFYSVVDIYVKGPYLRKKKIKCLHLPIYASKCPDLHRCLNVNNKESRPMASYSEM